MSEVTDVLVVPAIAARDRSHAFAWCGHRWNRHACEPGLRVPHCPECKDGGRTHYLMLFDDDELVRQVERSYWEECENGGGDRWRRAQDKLAARLLWRLDHRIEAESDAAGAAS